MRPEIDQSSNVSSSKVWQTPDLTCFGSVQNLTAGGTAGFSETFTNDGGDTVLVPFPQYKA